MKRLTIFSRLTIGYLVLFILVTMVSVYAILGLHELNNGIDHLLNIDNQVLDYGKKLSDSLLSELRYEKKYVITKDIALYNQFLSAKNDFDKYLAEALSIADTPAKRDSLEKVKMYHRSYESLVSEEVKYITMNRYYPKNWYEHQKETGSEKILKELEMLVAYARQDIQDRMKMLKEFGAYARRFAIIMSSVVLILILATSFFLTKSITKPLTLLMDKTREISKGVFKSDLSISSPPEMSELTKAFNSMCDKLKVVDKMKSDFFSMMSHELRTPLTSIKEGTSLLLEGVGGMITERQERLLTIVAAESNRLISLVNSLLDLSKMEAGMMTYHFEKASFAPLIENVMQEVGPLVESKKISLAANIDEKLPTVRIDRERMLQVLRNLIGNAVKFTPQGGQVKVAARSVDRRLEVSVANTGPGIPLEDLAFIFEKFRQGTTKGSHGSKGTGLGLAIARHIISSHDGKIWAESKPEQGSTFIFVLPV